MKTYQELLIEARAGGRGAFDELMIRFRPMTLSMARRYLGDNALAEDAVQEAFLTAYLKLDQLKNPTAFPSWIKAIIYSTCRSMRKAKIEETLLDGTPTELEPACRGDGPEELYVRRQTREMVFRVLESLPEAAREACRMRYMLGLPYRHIAEVLGVPVGTLKRRLHDARKKMVRALCDGSETVLRVGYMPITDHLLAMVSHRHCNERDGYAVRLQKFISWDSLARSLSRGQLDAAFVMVPLALHLKTLGVPLVYVLDAHHGGSSLTVPKAIARPFETNDIRMGAALQRVHTMSSCCAACSRRGGWRMAHAGRVFWPGMSVLPIWIGCFVNGGWMRFFARSRGAQRPWPRAGGGSWSDPAMFIRTISAADL